MKFCTWVDRERGARSKERFYSKLVADIALAGTTTVSVSLLRSLYWGYLISSYSKAVAVSKATQGECTPEELCAK